MHWMQDVRSFVPRVRCSSRGARLAPVPTTLGLRSLPPSVAAAMLLLLLLLLLPLSEVPGPIVVRFDSPSSSLSLTQTLQSSRISFRISIPSDFTALPLYFRFIDPYFIQKRHQTIRSIYTVRIFHVLHFFLLIDNQIFHRLFVCFFFF